MSAPRISVLASAIAFTALVGATGLGCTWPGDDDECPYTKEVNPGGPVTESSGGGTVVLIWPQGVHEFAVTGGPDLDVTSDVAREWRVEDAGTSGDAGARTAGDAGASTVGDAGASTVGDAGASTVGDAGAVLATTGPVGEPIGEKLGLIAVVRFPTPPAVGASDLATLGAQVVRCADPFQELTPDGANGFYCASAVQSAAIIEHLSGMIVTTAGTDDAGLYAGEVRIDGTTATGTRVTVDTKSFTEIVPSSTEEVPIESDTCDE